MEYYEDKEDTEKSDSFLKIVREGFKKRFDTTFNFLLTNFLLLQNYILPFFQFLKDFFIGSVLPFLFEYINLFLNQFNISIF